MEIIGELMALGMAVGCWRAEVITGEFAVIGVVLAANAVKVDCIVSKLTGVLVSLGEVVGLETGMRPMPSPAGPSVGGWISSSALASGTRGMGVAVN